MKDMSEEKLKEVSGGTYDLVDTQVNGDVTSYTFRRQGGKSKDRRSANEAGAREDEASVLNALPVDIANLLKSKAYEREACEKNWCLLPGQVVPIARFGVDAFKLNINNATGKIYYND